MLSVLIGLFLVLAIVSLAMVAGYLLWQDWQFFGVRCMYAEGKIVDYEIRRSDDSDFYVARVQFVDHDGGSHEFVDTYGRNAKPRRKGGALRVVYPVGAPQHARVKRPFVRLFLYIFVFGTPALVLAKYFGFLGG